MTEFSILCYTKYTTKSNITKEDCIASGLMRTLEGGKEEGKGKGRERCPSLGEE